MVSITQKANSLEVESDRFNTLFILAYKPRVTAARQKGSLILGWVDG